MFSNNKFILASNSKSRFFILRNNRLNFYQISPTCNEDQLKKQKAYKNIPLKKIPLMLAKAKAQSISQNKKDFLVVGSDTIIEFNGKIVEKANNIKNARKKIREFSGKKHKIYSSAVAYYNNKLVWRKTQRTVVKIRKLTKREIDSYLKLCGKNFLHSVGCYQIEKEGANIIESINGDFFNVMGFPLFPFLLFLKKFNIKK